MTIEMWESQDGANVTMIWARAQDPSRPVKIELTSEDDGEAVIHLSEQDFKSLLKAGLRFDEQISS